MDTALVAVELHRCDLAERFGLKLRVENNGELIESRLSRYGEAPLLLIAEELKPNLIEDGWFEVPDATGAG
jgi:hypothetical protein